MTYRENAKPKRRGAVVGARVLAFVWLFGLFFTPASTAHSSMLPLTPEQERQAAIFARCAMLMYKAQEANDRTAKEHANVFAGFVAGHVVHPAFAREQEKVRKKFVEHHERGHCKDREMTFWSEPGSHHRYYLGEAYADSYATLMSYREGASILALEQLSDLRAISQAILPMSGFFDDEGRWFRYHTAPIIDHTIGWIEKNGEELVDFDSDAVFALAQDLVGEAALSEEEHDNIKEALSATRLVSDEGTLEGLRIDWASSVPAETAVRIEGALARMGVRNRDIGRYLHAKETS